MSAYRDDIDALEARRAALASEVERKRRELDEASRLLAESKARASLPILDNIRVATPCSEPWSQMTGDARVRSCDACNQRVYDLSELTRDEAEALIDEHEGALCVRYFQRHDGTILLKDCAIGVQRTRTRTRRLVAVGAVALLTGGPVGLRALERGVDARVTAASESCEPPGPAPSPDLAAEVDADAEAEAGDLRAAMIADGRASMIQGNISFSVEELEMSNRALADALGEAKVERARIVAERTAAKARLEAALADAESAAGDAAAALRARQAAEAELEATQARARELERRLAGRLADDLKR